MVLGVASVLVYTGDVARAAEFYTRLLGVAGRPEGSTTMFVAGSLRLVLHPDKSPARAGVRGAMEFDVEVADAAAFHAALRERGIAADPPRRFPWGWTGFPVTDPDGNTVEVYQIER